MRALFLVALSAAGLASGLSSSAAAQEQAEKVSRPGSSQMERARWWLGLGLTDILVDLEAPGYMLELGAEWKPKAPLGLSAAVASSEIDEVRTCHIAGQDQQCMSEALIRSVALAGRVYVYQGRTMSAYGVAQIGYESHDVGRVRDLGYGMLFQTVGSFWVGVEARHRFGETGHHSGGRVWLLRVSRAFHRHSDSEGDT